MDPKHKFFPHPGLIALARGTNTLTLGSGGIEASALSSGTGTFQIDNAGAVLGLAGSGLAWRDRNADPAPSPRKLK